MSESSRCRRSASRSLSRSLSDAPPGGCGVSGTDECVSRARQFESLRARRRSLCYLARLMAITKETVAAHGLSPEEYGRILEALARDPNLVELGIFSAMWSEHCSYKSSRRFL